MRSELIPPQGQPVVRPTKPVCLAATHHCPPERQHILERNQRESPFLRLPAEVRNRIYEHVLGNRFIHVRTRHCRWDEEGAWWYGTYYHTNRWSIYKYLRFTHVVCRLGVDCERTPYEISKLSESKETGKSRPYDARHIKCHAVLIRAVQKWYSYTFVVDGPGVSDLPERRKNGLALDLSLLRVSRQIHREAALVPYTSNTFAFQHGLDLDLFISESLLAPQREAILRIHMWGWMQGHNTGIRPAIVRMLKGLKHISLSVSKFKQTGDVYQFGQLGLEKAEVIVGADGDEGDEGDRLKRRKQAEEIERALMETGGVYLNEYRHISREIDSQ